MKKLALLFALVPMLATAQTPPAPPAPPAAPAPPGMPDPARMQQMQKRAQLALTLGLAQALELDDATALKLRSQIEKLAPRRMAAMQQMRDSVLVLRRAAKGEKVAAGEVDAAIGKLLDARAQMQAVDRDTVNTVTQGLSPEKKARGVLFLAKFHQRMAREFQRGAHGGRGGGPGGPGMRGPGPGGMGGPMGMNAAPGGPLGMNDADGDWDDDGDN
jgi:hypothetical protein